MRTDQIFIKGKQVEWQDVGGGLRRQILGNDSDLMLVRVKFPKGGVGVQHSHPHRQVSYIEEGSFEVEISGTKQVLRAGDSFYVPPHAKHGAVALEDSIIIDVFNPTREEFLKE